MNSRRLTMVIAVVVALAAGLLTMNYLTSVQPKAPPAEAEMRSVVIASRDIRPHEKIVPEMLTKVQRTADEVEPGSLSDPKQAEGDVSLIAIPEGAPVTATKIGEPAAIGITGKLRPGQRAISIPVDFVKSVSALVEPGDHVDVLASTTKGHPTRTIIRGAVVLAVNSTLEPEATQSAGPNGTAPAPGQGPVAVTLGVTPEQANALTYADLNSTLRLALRSPAEPVRAFPEQPIDMDTSDTVAARNVPAPVAIPAPSVAAVPAPAPTVKPSPGILVIEGSDIVGGGNR